MASVLTIVGALLTIIVGSYRTKRASVSEGTSIRVGRYAWPTMVSAWLSPLLEPLRAPPSAAETSSNRWVMVAMMVTVRCAVMVGEGAPRGLSSLFYSSNCSCITAPSLCAQVTAVESKIMCISPLTPPKTTKIALFLKKHHEKFGGVQKSHYLCNRLRQVRAFSSAGLEHLPYKQRVGGSNPSTPTGVFSR